MATRPSRSLAAPALGAALALCLAPTSAEPGPPGAVQNLEALMTTLARVQQVEADYVETLESDLLETAISTRGRLVYRAPDRIDKIGEHGEQVSIDGDRLLVRDGSGSHELSVRDYAPLERMVTALRATFAGDLVRLRQDFETDFGLAASGWSLALRPRERDLAASIERVEIAGHDADIERIAIAESGGDRRTLRLKVLLRRP